MIFPFSRRLNHFFDNMIRSRLVRIPHAEVNNILPAVPSLELEALDLREDIGRKPLEPIKII